MDIPTMGGPHRHPGVEKGTFPPCKRHRLLKDASSTAKTGMVGPKKPLKIFNMALFAWFFAGVALWVFFVAAPVEAFVVDDPVQIDEESGSGAFQGASPPCWPCAAERAPRNTPLPSLVRLPSSPAAENPLAGAIFRLKLVRLHPPVGPPRTFFAEPVTG